MSDNHMQCKSPKIKYAVSNPPLYDYQSSANELADDEAGYTDMEEYAAEFFTGPKFGCIHHEEKT